MQSPRIFISFSSRDQNEVRKLFSALDHQKIEVWDYSDEGQELPLAHSLESSLKRKIDESDYFIAVISRNSVHEETGRHSRFEVSYALEKERQQKQNRVLPLILKNSENLEEEWLNLYKDFRNIRWSEIDFNDDKNLEDGLREICCWLSVPYVPSALKKVFFAKPFFEETETIKLSNSNFIKLMKIINSCANYILEEDWEKARNKMNLFVLSAEDISPPVKFYYPIIIRGICEFQLNELDNAKRTLLSVTTDSTCKNRQIMGLGIAALGQIHFALEQYETALEFYEKAAFFLPEGNDIPVNKLNARIHAGASSWDETILGEFDINELSARNLLEIIKLKGIVNYRKGDFHSAIEQFGSINLENLDECAAIYYGLSLMDYGRHESAIDILSFTARRLNSANIYHHLADIYIRCGYLDDALEIYDQNLCHPEKPDNWRRQFFIEYARILRHLDIRTNQIKIRDLCEKVLDFTHFSHPQNNEDFFYMGYANFLLGRNDLAKFDFERSSGFCEKYYDKIDF